MNEAVEASKAEKRAQILFYSPHVLSDLFFHQQQKIYPPNIFAFKLPNGQLNREGRCVTKSANKIKGHLEEGEEEGDCK